MTHKLEEIKICSFNANGLGDAKKRKDVFTWLRERKYDICMLQETHFSSKLESYIKAEWGYEAYFSHHLNNSRGVAILFRNSFPFKINRVTRDSEGRFIMINIMIRDEIINLVNIYGPNDDNPEFFRSLQDRLECFKEGSYIIGGDFNVVQDYELDTLNITGFNNPNAREKLLEMQQDLDLSDPWRVENPSKKLFTWHARQKHSRLDYFLTSTDMLDLVSNCHIKPG